MFLFLNVDACNTRSSQDAPRLHPRLHPHRVSTLAALLGAIDLFTCAQLTGSH